MLNWESSPESSLYRENERIPLTLLSHKGLSGGTASVPVTLLWLRGDEMSGNEMSGDETSGDDAAHRTPPSPARP